MSSEVRVRIGNVIEEYMAEGDVAHENANTSVSPSGLLLAVGGEGLKKHNFKLLKDEGFGELVDLHEKGGVHIHDLSLGAYVAYCAGSSLSNLLNDGIDSSIRSTPAKHFASAVNHIVNYFGTMANDFAGAQAFNDVDMYLAPYAYKLYLDYKKAGCSKNIAFQLARKEIYQNIQSLVFHLNYKSRWGSQCVTMDTECLSADGWKKYKDLKVGDEIYVFKDDGSITTDTIVKLNKYKAPDKMIRLKNRKIDTLVSPEHRVVRKKFNTDSYELIEAKELQKFKTPIKIPIAGNLVREDYERFTDDEVRFLAWILSDGGFEKRGSRITLFQSKKKHYERMKEMVNRLGYEYSEHHNDGGLGDGCEYVRIKSKYGKEWGEYCNWTRNAIPKDFKMNCSARQAKIFIEEYILTDGWEEEGGRQRIFKKDMGMIDDLQEMLVFAGLSSSVGRLGTENTPAINIFKRDIASITTIEEAYYEGEMWCPSTFTGTFIARNKHSVFVTGNSPFTNITMAFTVPDDMKDQLALIGGKPIDSLYDYAIDGIRVNNHTYGDLVDWQRLVTEAFLDVLLAGDGEGKSFTFPVLTINVTEDFFKHPAASKVYALAAKFGYPFFQNFVNGKSGGKKISPADTRSMCCRLSLSIQDVAKHTGGIFGGADNTGSIQVITLSLPYLAMEAKESGGGLKEFYERVFAIMDLCKDEQMWKRKVVDEMYERGFFELAKQNFRRGFDTFFSTIGFIGLWECVEILTGDKESFVTDGGMVLAKEILNKMTERCNEYMENTGKLFNIEAIPAESASYKLAKKAIRRFPKIPYRGVKSAPYFTNSCHIPVEYQSDLELIFKTQGTLQQIPTGGTVTHFTTGEVMTDKDIEAFIKTVCNTTIPYFSVNTVFSVCPICGYVGGYHETCPNHHTEEEIAELKRTRPDMVI